MDKLKPNEVNNALFMGTKSNKSGMYRIDIQLKDPNDFRLTFEGATQPNELIYKGKIQNKKNAFFKVRRNNF